MEIVCRMQTQCKMSHVEFVELLCINIFAADYDFKLIIIIRIFFLLLLFSVENSSFLPHEICFDGHL